MKYTKPYVERLSDLAIKGKKAKLQFPTAVRERLIEECGFTLDEKTVLSLRAEGKSILEMSGATVPDMSEDWATSQHALFEAQ